MRGGGVGGGRMRGVTVSAVVLCLVICGGGWTSNNDVCRVSVTAFGIVSSGFNSRKYGMLKQHEDCSSSSSSSSTSSRNRSFDSRSSLSLSESLSESSSKEDTDASNSNTNTKVNNTSSSWLRKVGIKRLAQMLSNRKNRKREQQVVSTQNIGSIEELDEYFTDPNRLFRKRSKRKNEDNEEDEIDFSRLLASICIKGDTQKIGSVKEPELVHPVSQLLHERRISNSKPGARNIDNNNDNCKIALSIEGGGMRGCVSAGMVVALDHLNLRDSFDVVYGSSAGTIIGSYFLTNQLPWFGPEIYYDSLTTANRGFIDLNRFLRTIGIGLLDPRLWKDTIFRREAGKPLLNLNFLLKYSVMYNKPLDWDTFEELQDRQPLKVIVSGLKSEKALILGYNSTFQSLDQYTDCMHASCLLPGIAGPAMNMCYDEDNNPNNKTFVLANNLQQRQQHNKNNSIQNSSSTTNNTMTIEPLADALLYEPLPYRSALVENATHVVILRTRPDGVDVTGKPNIIERLISKRFFVRKNNLPNIYNRVQQCWPKRIYGEDILRLNDASTTDSMNRHYRCTKDGPHLMPIALPPNSPEVGRLETDREKIFEGVRRGFARAYDALVEDPSLRGQGTVIAKQVFPDEILDYDPLQIDSKSESAYAYYLRMNKNNASSL